MGLTCIFICICIYVYIHRYVYALEMTIYLFNMLTWVFFPYLPTNLYLNLSSKNQYTIVLPILLLFPKTILIIKSFLMCNCRNPNLAKCGGEAQHLEKWGVWSPPGLPNVQSSTAGPKTPRIGVFLVSLERFWSVDIENALALGIWTSDAQVMGKRKAGSQTGSLTPDH
jgi:hypothetical protein